nr:pentatricopeptide repeat-containing protein At2g03880, mitochondrial [Tanacetum cinerariifolium]
METCATLSQKVAELEQDKQTQALEILKLKNKVKKLEKKRKSKHLGLKRGKIEAIDVDKDITLVDMETQVDLGAELQRRKDDDNATSKDVNAAEPTVFDDEEMAKRLYDEEVEQAAAREKQEKDDLERAQVLQQHLKRKPVSIAQARKNMIIYLNNLDGYKMEHFRGMTYDKVRPVFEKEYKKVQTLFKPDKDVEEPQKKRVAEETLLQESFKKLKPVEVSGSESTQETPTNNLKEMTEEDVQNMLDSIPVSEFKVQALYVKDKDLLKSKDPHLSRQISYMSHPPIIELRIASVSIWGVKTYYHEDHLGAIECFHDMRAEGVEANQHTFPSVLTSCEEILNLRFGVQVHECIVKGGFGGYVFVESALVDMYAKCGNLNDVMVTLESMDIDDVVSRNTIVITGNFS